VCVVRRWGELRRGRRKKRKDLFYFAAPPTPCRKLSTAPQSGVLKTGGPTGPARAGRNHSFPTHLPRRLHCHSPPGWYSKKLCCRLHWTPDGRWIDPPPPNNPSPTPPLSTRRLCEPGSGARLSTSPGREKEGGGGGEDGKAKSQGGNRQGRKRNEKARSRRGVTGAATRPRPGARSRAALPPHLSK
jgi:hypothetical protein